MTDDLAFVRRPYLPGNKPIRTGSVLVEEGGLYRVQWDDNGREEETYLGDFERVVRRGSIPYLAALDRLNAAFAADPLAVIVRVIAESDSPVTVRMVKAHLIESGLDPAAWSSNSSNVLKSLLAHDGVASEGEGASRTFHWAGGDLPALPEPADAPTGR